jgi:hypothetical protein
VTQIEGIVDFGAVIIGPPDGTVKHQVPPS